MDNFVKVAKVGEILPGEGRAFTISGRRIAIFLNDGEYFAVNDFCPHMGASLAEGTLDDGGVMCPWHAWKFCVESGTWLDNPKSRIRLETFAVRVVGEEIQIEITDEPPSSYST